MGGCQNSGGGKTPVNIVDPSVPEAGVLTLVESVWFHVTHKFSLAGASLRRLTVNSGSEGVVLGVSTKFSTPQWNNFRHPKQLRV